MSQTNERGIVDKAEGKGEYGNIPLIFCVLKMLTSYDLLCYRGVVPQSNRQGREDVDTDGNSGEDKTQRESRVNTGIC